MDVKRIFFIESSKYPRFEMEDGTIKKPYFTGSPEIAWMDDDGHDKHIKQEEQNKPKGFGKILAIFGLH